MGERSAPFGCTCRLQLQVVRLGSQLAEPDLHPRIDRCAATGTGELCAGIGGPAT